MADEPVLTQTDFDAADEVLKRDPVDSRLHESKRRLLALLHAQFGRSTFRLYYGLRKPRGRYEEWRLQSWQQKITLEEMAELMRARAERPVDQEMIEEGFAQLELRLKQYSLARHAVAQAVNPRYLPVKRASFERMATKHFVRTRRKFTLDRRELFTLHEYLDHARLEAGLGLAVAGEHSATNAMLLLCLVIREADRLWHSSLATAARSRTDPRYLYETSAAELWQKVSASSYPRPQHLLTLLEQEQTAAKVVLRRQHSAAPSAATFAVNNATFEVRHADFSNMQIVQPVSEAKDDEAPKPGPLFTVERWSEVAIGYDPRDGFWALKDDVNLGDAFPKSKAIRLEIPLGQLHSLLVALAESENGNSVPMGDVIKLFDLLPSGAQLETDSRAKPGAIESGVRTELLGEVAGARSKVSGILSDLGRKFREGIDGPKGRGDSCFSVRKWDVHSGFVVRCLCGTPERTYTFGPPRC